MYLKVTGCLGIVVATSGYGYSRGIEYQRQITDTGELQRVIRQLAEEIEYTYAPLSQVCASVSRRCSQVYKNWLEDLAKRLEMATSWETPVEVRSGRRPGNFEIIWEESCKQDLAGLRLGEEERLRLCEIGMQLGSLDKKQEMQTFLQYAEFLEEKRDSLLKEIQEKRRLCNLLGIMAGLFLTILIL